MPVLMLVAAVIILAGVVVVASGRGGEIAPEYPDYPPIDLGPVTAADVVMLRPPSAAWGYNMRVTDEALETIARAVTERDVRISALEQEVSDLRGQVGTQPAAGETSREEAAGETSREEAAPAGRPDEEAAAAGEPAQEATGPAQEAPASYEAAAHGQPPHETAGYADATHEEPSFGAAPFGPAPYEPAPYEPAPYEELRYGQFPHDASGDLDAGPEEPAFEAAAHGQPPHETVSYADAAHEESADPDPAGTTSPHVSWEASAQPSAWEPGRPNHEADDAADSGPATDPDLPRVPADDPDLSRPPSFWDAAPPAAPPAETRASGDEPDAIWDERPHQTLVWGVAHQRAKASRLQEPDEAEEEAAQPAAGQDEPGPADYEEARQSARGEQDHE